MIDELIETARARAAGRVAELRARKPGADQGALARELIRSAARRAGWSGAATGALSLFTLPIGLPLSVAAGMLHEAELIFALLELDGLETAGEAGRARLFALWAGAGFAGAARSVGLKMGSQALGAVLRGSLPGQIIRRLNPLLIKAILARLGLGWAPRVLKLWPILGAPISYAIDRGALAALGAATHASIRAASSAGARREEDEPQVEEAEARIEEIAARTAESASVSPRAATSAAKAPLRSVERESVPSARAPAARAEQRVRRHYRKLRLV